MKLCKDCKRSELLGQYRVCLELTPVEAMMQVKRPKEGWVLCINARNDECGPDAKFFKK